MICLVLAGGSSDRLWPLSRKDYPKQFMEIREGRSMFQETILRNIPFCDEFVILTHERYENVVRGQLRFFQSVKYTIVSEREPLKTAPPVIAYAKGCDPEETLLIVSSECLIEGDYAASMAQVKEIAARDQMAIVVTKPTNAREGYNFINVRGKVISCSPKRGKNSLWDCGIMGVKAGSFLKIMPRDTLTDCESLRIENGKFVSEKPVTPVNLSKILHTDKCELIRATFEWTRITDISSFYDYVDKVTKNNNNTIAYNCKGVEIVNMLDQKLIVANGLRNVVIVNTRDTVYISDKTREADAKSIAQKYYNAKKRYFDVQPKRYTTWGTEETLYTKPHVEVINITVFPEESLPYRCRRGYVANLLVLQGQARLRGKEDEIDYTVDQNIVLADPAPYEIVNTGKSTLELMCTVRRQKPTNIHRRKEQPDLLVRLSPAFKDNLWGGTKIRDVFRKDVGDMDVIAESWELSAHPDGESKVAEGMFEGMPFSEYIETIGKDRLGWKAQGYEQFPVMIKFIDAKQNLSIQVHPADEYALSVEGQYGKSEMWYVLEAEEDACIYVGFNRDVTEEEIRRRIGDDTLMEVLNKIPVRKGDAYFLAAGTVHAIGGGCFICEVQQSSNVTYRLYDYSRLGKDGNKRELHVDKALDVLDMHAVTPRTFDRVGAVMKTDFVKSVIGECKYFAVTQYFVDGECDLPASEASFQAIVVLEGDGEISDERLTLDCAAGDTFFAAAKERVTLKGKMKVLVANV